jgi:hypothetical protein
MRLITLLVTVAALAVAAPAIADKGGVPHGGNGGGGGNDATATPTPTPSSPTTSSATTNSNKGGGGNQKSSDPSISIATVNGTSAAPTLSPSPKHGDTVTFATNAGSLAGWQWPMVYLSCSQNGSAVWGVLDSPGATFTVGGGSSGWTSGDATCRADLYAYGSKGGVETITLLKSTDSWNATW